MQLASKQDIERVSWSGLSHSVQESNLYGRPAALDKIIPSNIILNHLSEMLVVHGFESIEGTYQTQKFVDMKLLYTEMAKGTFDISKFEEKFRSMYDALFQPLYGRVHLFDYIFTDTKAIQILFPLELLNKFIEFRYFRYGYWLYDELLKMRSVMMNILLQFHLNADAKFHLRIDTHNIPFMDPLLRIHIRQTNRMNTQLRQKYFSSTFDLKQLVYKSLDTYFPNVTWRYIGGSVYINHQIFNLIKSLFELGLWGYSDLAELLENLTASIENLIKLEKASIGDVKAARLNSYPKFILFLADYFQRCRYEIAEICVHIITLVNDHALLNSLPWNPNNRSKSAKFESCLENIFFQDLRKSSILYNMITNYLMLEGRIEDSIPDKVVDESAQKLLLDALSRIKSKLQGTISELFEIITYEHNDFFIGSNNLSTQSTFDILNSADPVVAECLTEAHHIRRALIAIFEEIKMLITKNTLECRLKCENLQRILLVVQQSIDQKVVAGKGDIFSVALGLNNVQMILLAITNLVDHYSSLVDNEWLPKDCLFLPMFIIVKITDNVACQSIMLSKAGWELFNQLVQKQPLLSVMMVERIFGKSSEIFNGRMVFFKTFLKIYSDIAYDVSVFLFPQGSINLALIDNSSEEDGQQTKTTQIVNKIISMVIYSQCLHSLIKNRPSEQVVIRNFDVFVQNTLDCFFTHGLLSQVILMDDILKLDADFITGKEINFDSISELIKFSRQETYAAGQVKCLIYYFAVTTLKLFTLCTSRLVYGHVYSNLTKQFKLREFHDKLSYLKHLESGLTVKKNMLQLVSNFYIFSCNSHFNPRSDNVCWIGLQDQIGPQEALTNAEVSDLEIERFIEVEFGFLEIWAKHHYSPSSPLIKQYISDYVFEGLFPLIYKYLKGVLVSFTFSFSSSSLSISKAAEYAQQFERLDKLFEQYCITLNKSFDIVVERSQIDKFLSLMRLNVDNEDAPLSHSFGDLTKNLDNSTVDRHLEPDELYAPDLYRMRDIIKRLCRTIEEGCPKDKLDFIERYDRPTALKKQKSKLDEMFLNPSKRGRRAKTTKKLEVRLHEIDQALSSNQESPYSQFKSLCEAYKIKKSIWLHKDREGNSFYRFLDDQKEGSRNFMEYWMGFVKETFAQEPNKIYEHFSASQTMFKEDLEDLYSRKVFDDNIPMSLISFFDSIYRMVPTSKKIFFTDIENHPERILLIRVMFTAHREFLRFLFFKTFHDDVFDTLNDYFERLNEVFINFADKNNTAFKDLVAKIDYAEDTDYKQIVRINQTADRLLQLIEQVYLKRHPYLVMIERPEKLNLVVCQVRLMGELCSGPNIPCQAAIYNYSIDKILIPIHRVIDDVNSNFYQLKYESINYVGALLEDLDFEAEFNKTVVDSMNDTTRTYQEMKGIVRQHMANNIRANELEMQIIKLIKKLFIYTLFVNDPAFKKKLIATIKSDLETQRAELKARFEKHNAKNQLTAAAKSKTEDLYDCSNNAKLQVQQELMNVDVKISKLENLDDTYSIFEDRDAIILADMENKVKLTSPWRLIGYYKQYPQFSEHLLLKTCIQLQLIMTNLSKVSESFQTVTQNRMKQMYSYYGNKVPAEIRNTLDTTLISRLPEDDAPEDAVIFQFLALITQKIDVVIPNDDGGEGAGGVRKTMNFQLHPNCLFITNESKENFVKRVEPEELLDNLMDGYHTMKEEMQSNRRQFIRSKTLYYITLQDSLTRQRYCIWYLSLIMNIMLIVSLRTDSTDGMYYAYFGELTFDIFSLVIGGLSVLVFILWFLSRYKQILISKMAHRVKFIGLKHFTFYDYYMVYIGETIMSKSTPLQCMFHTLFSLLGAFVHPFFHTLHLLLIYLLSATAGYVIKSITTHIKQLAITLLMAIFFIYSMAFIVFINYQREWDGQVDNDGTMPMCRDMWECLFYVVNMGLRNGGGIADSQQLKYAYDDKWAFIAKTVYDLLFFILINVISLNIIFGIIIDTFADMRDKREERVSILKSKCLVCGESADRIEKNNESFAFHVRHKHDIWKYVYFQMYLEFKDPTEFTGIENSLHDHVIVKRGYDWFPQTQFEDEAIRIEQHKILEQISETKETLSSMKQTLSYLKEKEEARQDKEKEKALQVQEKEKALQEKQTSNDEET